MRFRFRIPVGSAFLACSLLGIQARSQDLEQLTRDLERLRLEMQAMKTVYQGRIDELEHRVRTLEQVGGDATRAPQAEASETGGGFRMPEGAPESEATEPQAPASFSSGQRTLQALNPEISVTGDISARYSDDSKNNEFRRLNFDGFEMAIQHPLDPYSQAKFFVTLEDGEFELEEGYITWESLPGSLGLKLGRFHTNFGRFNRFHKHALPWANRDLPTSEFFGEEGLIGEGASVSWLAPKLPWNDSTEAYFEVVNNSNDRSFSGRGFGDPIYIGRVLNYKDIGDNAYFEWGLSVATSHWDQDQQNRSNALGLDLSYKWQPLRRALYRSFELRSELLFNNRKRWEGGDPLGLFVSGEVKLSRRWLGGLRYQFVEGLEDQAHHTTGFSPFLTFWQSEWVRMRLQYDFLRRNFDENENRFFLQFTWSLGPHKHEAY